MKYEKSCGAVVFIKENESISFLLIKSRKWGHWNFPKGHMENDETESQTALREIFEETGLKVGLIDKFRHTINYYTRENISKESVYFIGKSETKDVTPQIIEIEDYRWLEYGEAYNLLTYEDDRILLEKAKNFIDSNNYIDCLD